MEKLCNECEARKICKKTCKPVNDILWKDNHVMEKHFSDAIMVFPGSTKERHFSELTDKQLDEISETEVIPWSSGDCTLTQTAVFIERFFNKTPCKELAERYGVKENTIVCMYRNAVAYLEKTLKVLDARKEGIKAVKSDRFTEDQKYFLLVSVFGFSGAEVARMFNRDHSRVCQKVKHMSERYGALFPGQKIKDENPIDDPPMKDKLTRADVIRMVDAYMDQGLSHRQAFIRIAKRYAEYVGRPVSRRGIESRYYKATGKKPKKSVYDGLSVSEIKNRMAV